MNRKGRMLICLLAGGLVLDMSAWGVTADVQGNPYQGIVERNVFALNPPPDPNTIKAPEPEPPEIIPQGIHSAFGRQVALFKTKMPVKPGVPPQEVSMMLSVGEREGEVEVLAIDEVTGTIKFRNHGKVQEKNVEKDGPKASTGPAAAAFPGISAPAVPAAKLPAPVFRPPPGIKPASTTTTTTFGAAPGTALKTIPTRTVRTLPATGGVPAPGTARVAPVPGGQLTARVKAKVNSQPPLSPEEQMAIMILQKEHNPDGPPIPPVPGLTE